MKFVFIDEVGCPEKNPKFLGLGAVIVNYNNYHKFKEHFQDCFGKLGWDKDIEFKGKYLFSKAGDSSVSIDKRIDFVKEFASGFNATKNARLNCFFCCEYNGNDENVYLSILKKVVKKIKKEGPGHKRVIGYFIDANEKIDNKKIIKVVDQEKPRDVLIFERPFFIDSDNCVPGIISADIFCYLKSWIELNPDEEGQLNIFGKISETNKKKLDTVREIISQIKKVKDIK